MSKALGAQRRLALRCRIDAAAAARSGDETAAARLNAELTQLNNAYAALLNKDISESQFWDRIQPLRDKSNNR